MRQTEWSAHWILRPWGQRESLQQPQRLHVLAFALLAQPRFHQTAQFGEAFRQVPTSQRRGLIQCIQLLLQQRQVSLT